MRTRRARGERTPQSIASPASIRVAGRIDAPIGGHARADADAAHLAAIVQGSDDAIVGEDLDGFVTSWNAGAERLFGYVAEEALGRPVSMLVPPDRLQQESGSLARVRRGERVEHFETQRVRKDGSLLDVSVTISPVRDAAGRVVGISRAARDVTERKRAERALRESEERFRTLADNVSQLAWTCDALGNATWYNQRWLDYTGLALDEVKGWAWTRVHHPDHLERVVRGVQRAAESGEPWEDVFPLRGKDGRYRWFLSRAEPVRDAHGEIVSWFGTNTDVTEQFEAEEALRVADRRKDEVLATLSHELRNPLASISSAVQVLKLQERVGENLVQQKAREIIERQVARLTSMVTDLLDFSRVSSGLVRLERERIDLIALLRHAVESVQVLLEKHGHELAVATCDEPVWVHADRERIEEVVVNLLSNSIQYTPDGGRIALQCEHAPGAGEVTIRVRDNGIGIDAQFLPRIFEVCSQADRSPARSGGGLGIGLSVARSVVELHGGTIEARSPGVGLGSEFVVRLPSLRAGPALAAADRGAADERRPSVGKRVLVVDDNVDQVLMLTTLLRRMGYSVQSAHTGSEGLRIAQQWRPDFAVLDIGLPGLDGYEVARRIRATPELERRNMRLIACTGYGLEADLQRAREAGFDAHVVKPVDVHELQAVMLVPGSRGAGRPGSG